MQSADLAMIKDIPGYKIIMKAVLKHQIQQLVEQLSETTGEESILLTASVSDRMLSHLGSESGKSFLDGHDEIKSQFLSFVLKRHHTQKTEKQFASSLGSDISSGHHTKRTEKQFVSSPGRKSATQQSLPFMYDDESDVAYTEASYYTEAQQDTIPDPAMIPTRSAGKKKDAKVAPSPSDITTRPKRSDAAMRSPLKSDIYVGENEDVEELSDGEQEQSESAAATATEPGPKETPVKYMDIFPVSGPIPVVPKLETEDSFQVQEYDEGSAAFSGTVSENSNLGYIVVKTEVGLDTEAEAITEEEDPDWEPGTKKRRMSCGSGSVAGPVNVSEGQSQKPQNNPVEKQRFKVVTEEEIKMMEESRQSLSTKRNTKWGVKLFQEWSSESCGAETDFATVEAEELNSKLRKFYLEATPKAVEHRQKSMPEHHASEYHKNTLKNVRGAINRHLKDIGRLFDIVKDKDFRSANNCLDGKLKHNVRQGVSRPTQHKEVISAADLSKIDGYLVTNQNPVILRHKVWYDLSVHFVAKGLEFHQQLNLKSFEFLKDENDVEYVILSHETKQKNHHGGLLNEKTPLDKRMYATGSQSCPVKSLKLLIEKTPLESTSLFNHCSKEALESPDSEQYWFKNKAVKPYQLSKFLSDICQNAKCSKPYTVHCLRATAKKAMNDSGS